MFLFLSCVFPQSILFFRKKVLLNFHVIEENGLKDGKKDRYFWSNNGMHDSVTLAIKDVS